jgi:chemotaxis protein MotB
VSKRKKHAEEHENSERWLVSYADFMTLLFAFFTTMYAISTVDAQKVGKMVNSMRASFDSSVFEQGSRTLTLSAGNGGASNANEILQNPVLKNSANTNDFVVKKKDGTNSKASSKKNMVSGEMAMGRLKRGVESLLSPEIKKSMVRVRMEPRGLVISLGENGIFDSGSDIIKPQGRVLLDTIATSLVALGNQIRVEGHTDNVPIRNSRFPSNWDLSTSRATAVVSRLITNFGLPPELLSAAGYAEYRPAATNDTDEGKARNRRVDIVVLNPMAARSEPQ